MTEPLSLPDQRVPLPRFLVRRFGAGEIKDLAISLTSMNLDVGSRTLQSAGDEVIGRLVQIDHRHSEQQGSIARDTSAGRNGEAFRPACERRERVRPETISPAIRPAPGPGPRRGSSGVRPETISPAIRPDYRISLTPFLPATVLRGPLRVRALVRVRWPWTGSPLRCRRPR